MNLEMAGFLGNFEALDQVVNNFNEYYPNVTISYEQNSGNQLAAYLQNNPYVDIFMTSDDNLRYPDARYESLGNTDTVQLAYTNTGAIEAYLEDYLANAADALAAGKVSDPEEAAKQYLANCAEVTAKMAAE